MRLSAEQITAVRPGCAYRAAARVEAQPFGLRSYCQRGFTMIELITVIVILGIISVVALARFTGRNQFDSHSFNEEVKATVRLAQKLAIAQHRNVCVTASAAAPASLTINVTKAASCDTPLPSLSGGGNYQVTARGDAALVSGAGTIAFDLSGSPGAADYTLQVDTEPVVTIDKETGYVHY